MTDKFAIQKKLGAIIKNITKTKSIACCPSGCCCSEIRTARR